MKFIFLITVFMGLLSCHNNDNCGVNSLFDGNIPNDFRCKSILPDVGTTEIFRFSMSDNDFLNFVREKNFSAEGNCENLTKDFLSYKDDIEKIKWWTPIDGENLYYKAESTNNNYHTFTLLAKVDNETVMGFFTESKFIPSVCLQFNCDCPKQIHKPIPQ